jgi:type II secretory pathway pseudopilin PulG
MKKINLNSYGFSLIELMVGLAIMITATTIVLAIIVSSFRLSSKSTIQDQVRQNGNYALSQMTKVLLYADSINNIADSSGPFSLPCGSSKSFSSIDVTYNKTDTYYFSCGTSDGLKSGATYSAANSMINPNIYVTSCEFKCTQADTAVPPQLEIRFKLQYGAGGAVVEKSAEQTFSTRIKMRNL